MVNFKIAGHTMGTPEYTVQEALALFHRIGLDGAEIVVQDDYRCGIPTDCGEETLAALKETAQKLGIQIIALTPYNSRFNSLDEKVRLAEMEGIRKVIGYAKYLGARYIRIYAGNFAAGDQDPEGKMLEKLVESMQVLGEEAKREGVVLVMENHFNTMSVSAAQSIEAARRIGHPNVGILYDQANLAFTLQEDYQTAIPLQMEKVAYVHVKDLQFKEGNLPFVSDQVSHPKEEERNVVTRIVGQGDLDWMGILQMMHDYGYGGWLSLEYERRWHPDDIPDASIGMKQSAKYLKKCFQTLT